MNIRYVPSDDAIYIIKYCRVKLFGSNLTGFIYERVENNMY